MLPTGVLCRKVNLRRSARQTQCLFVLELTVMLFVDNCFQAARVSCHSVDKQQQRLLKVCQPSVPCGEVSVRLRRRFDDSSRHLDGVALVDNDSPSAAPIVGVVSTSASRRVAWRLRRRYVGGTVHVIVDSKSTSESTPCRLHHSRRALGVGVGTVELARSVFRTGMLS